MGSFNDFDFSWDPDSYHRRLQFIRRYHLSSSESKASLVGEKNLEDTDYSFAETYGSGHRSTGEVSIKLSSSWRTWVVRQETISNHSNFFRIAFAGGFEEASSKSITLEDVDEHRMAFVIDYIHNGWHSAVKKTFHLSSESLLRTASIAEILILADYLDMPSLTYGSYTNLQHRLVELVMQARIDLQFAHNLCVRKKEFVQAARILIHSGCIIGTDLGHKIRRLLKMLEGVHDLDGARNAFEAVFPDEKWMIDRELQW
ncbi:hypothetical protein F4818DRAFT_453639 [Hypoxylon cercidicola]|nr:hypothetical protein F4818DRAFT_453639 [Hypoxylon cercidicola]